MIKKNSPHGNRKVILLQAYSLITQIIAHVFSAIPSRNALSRAMF